MSGGGPSSWCGRSVEEKSIVPLTEIELWSCVLPE
jgi:hypothetical protein